MPAAPRNASQRLLAQKERIMALWSERVRGEIPPARHEMLAVIINTLPRYLDDLAEALDPSARRRSADEYTTLCQEHGGERARLTSYQPRDILAEYRILGEVIVSVLEEEEPPLGPDDREQIRHALDESVSRSLTSYFLVANGIRDQFSATLTHDLRGPLTAAKANTHSLLRAKDDPVKVALLAARIHGNLDRIDRMVQDLLDVSRVHAGERLALRLEDCEAIDVVDEAIRDLAAVHGDRFVLDARPSIRGRWDPALLRRALENVLGNAVKYGDPRAPITVRISTIAGRAIFDVHNEGNPIPKAEQETLFNAFRRMRSASSTRGWGLGLALVRGVAESHGGSVGVSSTPDRGTTFTIDIPLDARPFLGKPVTG